MASRRSDRVRFNVGGKVFDTTSTTVANAGRNSMLGALIDESWNPRPSPSGEQPGPIEYFIDRNPACFGVLLDLLRTGELDVPPGVPEKMLFREALYYGLLDHVRAARWGAFDGNRLRLVSSVPGHATGDGTAVRAGPDGGCCVAHGPMVHVYDWMLEEHCPISFDHRHVNDVGYIDAGTIVVTARERLGMDDCGMGAFSASTGALRHRYRVAHDGQVKSFSAGALSFSSADHRIFASCKGRWKEHGIGVWDQITGQQVDFFYEQHGCLLGDADKLQWIDDGKCLMVATLFPRTDGCFIGLLDFRDKSMVWSWSDAGAQEEKRVLHATAMEDARSICVVDQYDDLGFIDLRRNAGSVRWSSRVKLTKYRNLTNKESCYPKLAAHGGQLFLSTNDSVDVFCGPEGARRWTSTLRSSHSGGSICDFSIGGERLFVLHGEENVFDVWETPPSPVI